MNQEIKEDVKNIKKRPTTRKNSKLKKLLSDDPEDVHRPCKFVER